MGGGGGGGGGTAVLVPVSQIRYLSNMTAVSQRLQKLVMLKTLGKAGLLCPKVW